MAAKCYSDLIWTIHPLDCTVILDSNPSQISWRYLVNNFYFSSPEFDCARSVCMAALCYSGI